MIQKFNEFSKFINESINIKTDLQQNNGFCKYYTNDFNVEISQKSNEFVVSILFEEDTHSDNIDQNLLNDYSKSWTQDSNQYEILIDNFKNLTTFIDKLLKGRKLI